MLRRQPRKRGPSLEIAWLARPAIAAAIAAAIATTFPAKSGVAVAGWEFSPSISLGAGHEEGILDDPDVTRTQVPGGAFLNAGSVLEVGHPWGHAVATRITGEGNFERFTNDARRQLRSASLAAELRARPASRWRARLEGVVGWFDDSAVATAERWDVAAEGALGVTAGAWLLEGIASARGRRYPELQVPDAGGTLVVYTEAAASGGAALLVRVVDGAFVRAEATRAWTDSRDAAYDATSSLLRTAAQVQVTAAVQLRLFALVQHRDFRLAGVGHDDYAQLGAGCETALFDDLQLSARWALARYQSPAGSDEDTQRFELGCTVRFGRHGATSLPWRYSATDDLRSDAAQPNEVRSSLPYLFRVHAPKASRVAVVGDFNHWSPDADSLQPAGDGFWELRRALPAGTWQYAYLVDGDAVFPPEASVAVDDGFGGRNGVLVVLP